MTTVGKVNDQCIPLQAKVFTRWVSAELNGVPNSNFTDITKDLSNGVALIELAEVLTHKKAPSDWEHQPTNTTQNVKNCKLALKMFRNDGFKAIGITSKDISENNEKQIFELVWQLISHYSIDNSFGNLDNKRNVSEANIKSQLLSWAIKRTQNYKRVFAFKPYDLAMCALLDSYLPGKINYYVLDLKDHQKNFKLIIDVLNELKIPCLIYPEDLPPDVKEIDKKALLAQLSFLRMALEVKPHLKEKRSANSRIQRKFDSIYAGRETPEKVVKRKSEKSFILNQDRLLRSQIVSQQHRVQTDISVKESKPSHNTRIPQKTTKNVERQPMKPKIPEIPEIDIKSIQKEQKHEEPAPEINSKELNNEFNETQRLENYFNHTHRYPNGFIQNKYSNLNDEKQEEKEIEKEISDDFNENKEEFKERKEEKKEEQIEKQIDDDFKENEIEYNERKNNQKKSHHLTIEQQNIEDQIDEEFRQNEEEYQLRKKEEKAEQEQHEIEEEQREGIPQKADRRPQFVNIV